MSNTQFEMNGILDVALAEAYANAPVDKCILCAAEIQHPAFSEPARVIQWPIEGNKLKEFRVKLEEDAPYDPGRVVTFLGVPFDITFPQNSASFPGTFKFELSTANSRLARELHDAAIQVAPIELIIREYIQGEEELGPRSVWFGINLKSPRCENTRITADGAVLSWVFRSFGEVYQPHTYPGLVRGR